MSSTLDPNALSKLNALIGSPVFQKGTSPLKNNVEIGVFLNGEGPVTLARREGKSIIEESAPKKADMTFRIPPKAGELLAGLKTEDVGEFGVELIKLMAHGDPDYRINVKVHVGIFDFITHGYLGILPLGGQTVMKHLSSMGLTGIGKIKDAIAKFRE